MNTLEKLSFKQILVILVLISLSFNASISAAQQSVNREEIKKIVKEEINQDNYTRIPNEDFDDLVNYKLSNLLDSKLTVFLAIVGAFITIFGGVITLAINKFLTDAVNKKLDQSLQEKSKELAFLIQKEIASTKAQIDQDSKQLKMQVNQIIEFNKYSKKFIYQAEVEKIKNQFNQIRENNFGYTDREQIYPLVSKLEGLLDKIESLNEEKLLCEAIDVLIDCYYYSREYDKIEQNIEKYTVKYELLYKTYFTASLPYFNSYYSSGAKEKKNKALEYLNKSLEIEPTYGESLALKLEIFMISYTREINDVNKEVILDNVQEVITQALSSPIASQETIDRLERDQKLSPFSQYVDKLYSFKKFNEQLQKMKEIGDRYFEAVNKVTQTGDIDILKEFFNQPLSSSEKLSKTEELDEKSELDNEKEV